VSHALEMTIILYYPTLELFCFSFTQPFTHSKFCLSNPFLSAAINNDWSPTETITNLKLTLNIPGVFQNTNTKSVLDKEKEKRDKQRQENEDKKVKDKEDREKQKTKAEQRKDKEKKRTQKGERRR
jgi:hypothetical protein